MAKAAMLGFGAVGRALAPCLIEAMAWSASDIVVLEERDEALGLARAMGLEARKVRLGEQNWRSQIEPLLERGTLLINLAVDVSTKDLALACRQAGSFYLDAGIEDWPSQWASSGDQPCMAQERDSLLSALPKASGHPTAVVGHGANPGLISHWVLAGLAHWARREGLPEPASDDRLGWARLAKALGLRVIQVAERDHGVFRGPKGAFANSWSPEGLAREAWQRGEMGWGSHEGEPPAGFALWNSQGASSATFPERGLASWVKTWTPMGGRAHGLAITHLESLGLCAALDDGEGYRPSAYYAYQVSAPAADGLGRLERGEWSVGAPSWTPPADSIEGVDELGALLISERLGSLWIGSRLDSAAARARAPSASATTLQVAAGLAAAARWAFDHPDQGLCEPEDLPWDATLALAERWIGPRVAVASDLIEPLGLAAPQDSKALRIEAFLTGSHGKEAT